MIVYERVFQMDAALVVDLYRNCTLGLYRPVDDLERMRTMVANSNLMIAAWDGDVLAGFARSLSDFAFCTYLADLAVRDSHQKLGIGRRLLDLTQEAGGKDAFVTLLAADEAREYYPKIGLSHYDSAWALWPGQKTRGSKPDASGMGVDVERTSP